MSITRHQTSPRMSQAVVHRDVIYLSGCVPDAPQGKSVTEQTQSVLAKIDALLQQAGSDRTKILSAQIWLADISTFQEMNDVWEGWVPKGHAPARATVEARMANPDYRVEVMVVAAL